MTLTQTAIITKQVITITIIASILGLATFIGYKIWYSYYLSTLPPVEEKEDAKFGILPAIDFPQSTVSSSNFTYLIDTTTGNLPKVGIDSGFEKIIKVYFVIRSYATLLSGEKSQTLAEKFGIKTAPQVLSETSYFFKSDGKSLNVDLDNGNFIYKKEATFSAQESLDDENKLVKDFENILNQLGTLKDDLKNGRSKVVVSKNVAQISFWPGDLDKKIIVTSNFNKSLVNASVIKSADNLENYLFLNFTFWPIDQTTFATYPLKSAEKAFEDLKLGKGIIVIEPTSPKVSITSIYLGYFMPENYHPYLQPIYIFEGPNFVAYTSAISEQYQSGAK